MDIDSLDDATKNQVLLSTKTLEDYGRSWQTLNHSVTLVGWGVDPDGVKYWILRNSYGARWGDSGDFKMRRGQNDFGLEAGVVAFDPVFCSS